MANLVMDYAFCTMYSEHLQQDKNLTIDALGYHEHKDYSLSSTHHSQQNPPYPSSCQLPRYYHGGQDDAWTTSLQSHYTSEHPHDPMATTQCTPCGSSVLPKTSNQWMVTYASHAFVQEPLTCWSTESFAPSQPNRPVEAGVSVKPWKLRRRMTERSLSISSSSSSSSSGSSWSSWASSGTEYETEGEFEANIMVCRRNKTLPPPILAPPCSQDCITASTTSLSWAFSSPSDQSISPSGEPTRPWAEDSCHRNRSGDDENIPLSGNWPKIERVTRCQQCSPRNGECPENRTSGLCPCAAQCRQPFVLSELPPPTSQLLQQGQQSPYVQEYHDDGTCRKFLALSASIWGPGWHQVEPLPPSFVRTMQQNELEAQEKALALAQEKAAQAAVNPKTKAKKAKQRAKAAAAAAATAKITTPDANLGSDSMAAAPNRSSSVPDLLSSARLPRSLQFVD